MQNISVKEIMTGKVHSVNSETMALKAIEIMRKEKISCLIVSRSESPDGIFTERDIVRAIYRGVSFNTTEIDEL